MLKQNRKLAVRLRLKNKSQTALATSSQANSNSNIECSAHEFLKQQNKALCANIDELAKVNISQNQVKHLQTQLKQIYARRQIQLSAAFQSKLFCEAVHKMRTILIGLMKQSAFMLEMSKQTEGQESNKQSQGQKENIQNNITLQGGHSSNYTNIEQQLLQSNRQLKNQLSDMEHYIITLKQLLNEQQKKTESLLQQNSNKQQQLNKAVQILLKKQSECRILQEEIAGYEQKIEQLETQQISGLKQLKNGKQKTNNNQQASNNQNLNDVSFETSLQLNNINHENQQVELKHNSKSNSKEIDMEKLQIIYQKTEKLLKKCQHLQQIKNNKEIECLTLKKIIQSIITCVGIQHIATNINQQTGYRIVDKIQTLKSKCNSLQTKKQISMDNIEKSVEQLQSLLKQSNVWLTNENNDFYDFVNYAYSDEGIDVFKVNQYLDELQKTIKSIYKLKYGDLQASYIKKIQQQQNYLNTVLESFDNFTKHTQRFVENALRSAQGNVQNLQKQVKVLAQHLHQFKQQINTIKSQRSQIQKRSNQIINGEISKMITKYYPKNIDFVEDIITKIIHLRVTQKEQEVSLILDSIFESIKVKDEQIRSQMGRKKQVVKLRSAAIAQICKKGMKDSFSNQN